MVSSVPAVRIRTFSFAFVADAAEAQKTFNRAEQIVSAAAQAILVYEATSQAAALRTAWSTMWRLADQLNALAGSRILAPNNLPTDLVGVLQMLAARPSAIRRGTQRRASEIER